MYSINLGFQTSYFIKSNGMYKYKDLIKIINNIQQSKDLQLRLYI